jgi:tetratricopeptide (TPR) repeat protein
LRAARNDCLTLIGQRIPSWSEVTRYLAEQQERVKRNVAQRAARSVKDFLTEQLLGTANPFIDPQPAPYKRPLLDGIVQQLEGKFSGQPRIEAEFRFALGDAFKGLGEFARSAAQYEQCLQIRRRVLAPDDSDTLQAIAWLASAYIELGRKAEAEKLLADAVDVVRTLPPGLSVGAGWVLHQRGYLLFRNGKYPESVVYLRQALRILKEVPQPKEPHVKTNARKPQWAVHGDFESIFRHTKHCCSLRVGRVRRPKQQGTHHVELVLG